MDTVYKVCVEKSDGKQLDYNSLASKTSGTISKYLIIPTVFPSMIEDEEEEEEEGEEDGEGMEEIKEQ